MFAEFVSSTHRTDSRGVAELRAQQFSFSGFIQDIPTPTAVNTSHRGAAKLTICKPRLAEALTKNSLNCVKGIDYSNTVMFCEAQNSHPFVGTIGENAGTSAMRLNARRGSSRVLVIRTAFDVFGKAKKRGK